jgi:hypothetical protein
MEIDDMSLDFVVPALAFGTILAFLVFGIGGYRGAKKAKQEGISSSLSDDAKAEGKPLGERMNAPKTDTVTREDEARREKDQAGDRDAA